MSSTKAMLIIFELVFFLNSVKFWTEWWHLLQIHGEFAILVCWTFTEITWNIRGNLRGLWYEEYRLVVAYRKKVMITNSQSIGRHNCCWQYFLKQVLLLPILSKSIVNNVRFRRGRKFIVLVVGGRAASWWPLDFHLRVRRPYISRTMGRATS